MFNDATFNHQKTVIVQTNQGAYNVFMVRTSVDASGDGGSSLSTLWGWIGYTFKASWNSNYWKTTNITQANFLSVSCISNERIDSETFFHFSNLIFPEPSVPVEKII
jgi:hypothetical protein